MGALSEDEKARVLDALKGEPMSIQEVSRLISRSWVTTDTYLRRLKEATGLIDIKTFRKGSHGALKVVFYKQGQNPDLTKKKLFDQIMHAKVKQDFDFMELFQFVPSDKKKSIMETYENPDESLSHNLHTLFHSAKHTVFCFSGNLSFLNVKEQGVRVIDLIEEVLKRNVSVKILTRITMSTLNNISKIKHLLSKYDGLLEIRHTYQPLRGFIVDDSFARFKNDEHLETYKKGELHRNVRIFYEVFDPAWIAWLQDVFWNHYHSAIDSVPRIREITSISQQLG